jgi:hypothetical protein
MNLMQQALQASKLQKLQGTEAWMVLLNPLTQMGHSVAMARVDACVMGCVRGIIHRLPINARINFFKICMSLKRLKKEATKKLIS